MSVDRTTRTLPTDGDDDAPRGSCSPFLFLVLESHRLGAPSARIALRGLSELVVGRGPVRSYEQTPGPAGGRRLLLRTDDAWMSTAHARFVNMLGQFWLEDLGSKNGSRCNGQRTARVPLEDGDLVELGRTFFLFRASIEAADEPPILDASSLRPHAPGLATLLPSLARVHADLCAIARGELPVLIEGETGTGKEVTARAIHAMSGRQGEFVSVNCAALPEPLVEAELFGHRRGAFSDAKEDRPGLVRAAHGGTLFLDEVGELRLPAQASLLRVLEEREVRPLGATQPSRVDVRFVAATNRALEPMMTAGTFRTDLFHRLAGHRVTLPSLAARREDLGMLIHSLIDRHRNEWAGPVALHQRAARLLFEHSWPGNVRELEKALGAAILLARGGEVKLEHLPPSIRRTAEEDDAPPEVIDARKAELVALLREHRGNVSAIARATGKARMQVQRWLKRYGLTPEQFRT